jgi:hypothetical protein
MIKASQYRNHYTVIFRDAAGNVIATIPAFAKTAADAVKNAVTYGGITGYHSVRTD